jgi:NAD(P)-dependent dehydrogenase (short-subunit alcohol dehydrogenase family)
MADTESSRGRLAGRVVLITGASRGIGAAAAAAIAGEGAQVVLTARTVGGLEETDDAVRAAGGDKATLISLDLTNFDEVDKLGPAIYQRFGRLDILVANAAVLGALSPVSHGDPKLWQTVLDTNLTANYRLVGTLDPLLRGAPAGIALFATCAVAREPRPYWSGYAVSKAGLETMVRLYAAETAKGRLRVQLVDPGPAATKLRAAAYPGEDPATLPTPADAARAYLEAALSPAASGG